jgi:hypothetical protein
LARCTRRSCSGCRGSIDCRIDTSRLP